MQETTHDPVMDAVRRSVLVVLPEVEPGQIGSHRSLEELGCNSIDRADVVTLTMEDLDVSVPVNEFARVRDIGTLVELLRAHMR